MGAWGGGLYESDYALDLMRAIKGLWRVPISDDELLLEIGAPTTSAPDDIDALDHWVILADQLERAGLRRRDVFDRAVAIIESGQDLAALEALGSNDAVLNKRRKVRAELLGRLRNPRPPKERCPLTRPQPLLFEENDALTWPTDKGRCINPYVAEDKLHLLGGFNQDGWGFGIVTAVGHHYGVLAYHSVQALKWRRPVRPSSELAARCPRSEHHYGTMSPLHCRRLKVERLGAVPSAALGPPQDLEMALADSRKAALENIGLSRAFGWDAFNKSVGPGPKFMFSAPARVPLDPDEPDHRGRPFQESEGFDPLPPDRPADRGYYYKPRIRARPK